MDFIAPILASAGFVIVVQLIINVANHSSTFRQWKIQRKASIEDELHNELKRQNSRHEDENRSLHMQIDEWQDKYYHLLVAFEKAQAAAAVREEEFTKERVHQRKR